jgi:hypothetical protein
MEVHSIKAAIAAGLACGLLLVQPVEAQWPTVLMFHGGPLKAPI